MGWVYYVQLRHVDIMSHILRIKKTNFMEDQDQFSWNVIIRWSSCQTLWSISLNNWTWMATLNCYYIKIALGWFLPLIFCSCCHYDYDLWYINHNGPSKCSLVHPIIKSNKRSENYLAWLPCISVLMANLICGIVSFIDLFP